MNKRVKKLLLIFVITVITIINIVVLIINISTSNNQLLSNIIHRNDNNPSNVTDNTTQKNTNNASNSIQRDKEYKMFYGEWKVTRIVGKPNRLSLYNEEAENFINQTISYTFDSVKINGVEDVKNPQYFIRLIPVTPDNAYIYGWPSLDEIGITGSYFAYVGTYNPGEFLAHEFYVKDDATLIMFRNNVYYELKRLSYIEGAESSLRCPG